MANNKQNEFSVPASVDDQDKRQSARHLPTFFRTDQNKKFLGGTLDVLTQPGKLDRINAYVGRKDIPNYNSSDNYVQENSTQRQYYQLEPGFVYQDNIKEEVHWYTNYVDYINSLKYFGAPVANHSRLNKQEAYTWDPHIDWDKFVNYREYYWLPNGPDPITITGELESVESTYTVTIQQQGDNTTYLFSPDIFPAGLTSNPRITLYRGLTYKFIINGPGKQFSIKTQAVLGDVYFYNIGVSQQRISQGILTFTVPNEAPDLLYYIDNLNIDTVGMIDIKDINEVLKLDVEKEILGKKTYKTSSGIDLVNGLKVKFSGQVTPAKYADSFWYVEGVGDKIKLINYQDLETPAIYGSNFDLPFDEQAFDSVPYDSASNYPATKDYIIIHRASKDRNTWSRSNRWFNRSVIEITAAANNQTAILDQSQRAVRPIIEFQPDLKLFNYGWKSKKDVNFIDTINTDVFSTVEGSIGYKIDGDNDLLPGHRVIFIADTDSLVNGRIFEVKKIVNANIGRTQLTLQEAEDSIPSEGDVVYVTEGDANKGYSYYYLNGKWNQAQHKTKVNQAPLFDLFDEQYMSYSDPITYYHNDFSGNRVFGYKSGTITDSVLGFDISYLNINNVGDIEFEFDLETQKSTYQNNDLVTSIYSYAGFLRKYNDDETFSYHNGWLRTVRDLEQYVTRVLDIQTATDLIAIDVYDKSAIYNDLRIKVYVNDVKVNASNLSLETIGDLAYVRFNYMLNAGDKVVYKVRSIAAKNLRGYYEIPLNWQNNPLNSTVTSFTFGEVTDHVKSIIEDAPNFVGSFPGSGNLANIGPITQYGRKFLQHGGSMALSSYLMTDSNANVIRALRWTAKKYSEFKKEFLRLAQTRSYDGTIPEQVDQILLDYSRAKYVDTSPFHFSDMSPYGAASIRIYTVTDPRLPVFVIDSIFDPKQQTRRSVLVYKNEVQLVYGRDYIFNTDDAFVEITVSLVVGDIITVRDYASTDGCYIPLTPSKLGMYPSYIPEIYLDDTYLESTYVIQGHDGSIIKAYGDYRDDLILELEKRIYNTRRVDYDIDIFNIHSVIGSYYFKGDFNKVEINDIMLTDFLSWNSVIDQDFSSNNYFVENETSTYNYGRSLDPNNFESLPGYWRGIYKYFYDTDRPHTHPWEIQGFTVKPAWWETVYGKAPYTSDNKILWDSIESGVIREPGKQRIINRYKRPGMRNYLPVDGFGNLLSPLDSGLAQEFALINARGTYIFGDQAPVEAAWRRSSEYPFSVMAVMCVLRGAEFIGKMWDRFTIKRNIAGQMYYTPTGKRVQLADLIFSDVALGDPNDPNVGRTQTSGISNIIEEYVFMQKYVNIDTYKTQINGLNVKLSYRFGGYTSKEKIKILLDSRSPNASGTVFLPVEDYQIFYNKSFPTDVLSYSGVLIERLESNVKVWEANKRYQKNDRVTFQTEIYRCVTAHISNNDAVADLDNTKDISIQRFAKDADKWVKETSYISGFKIKGYDTDRNYFEIYPPRVTQSDPSFNVGGISESYVEWQGNPASSTATLDMRYYAKGQIVKVDNTSFYRAIRGHTASTNFEDDLKNGLWQKLSALPIIGGKTALRRTRFEDTIIRIPYGTIFTDIQTVVDFLFGYQKRLETLGFEFDGFNNDLSVPLDWFTSAKEFLFWTLQNWDQGAVITLSPSATELRFKPKIKASVDGFNSDYFDYSIFKADGTPLRADLTDVYREDGGFTMSPSNSSNDGIFHVRANLVHREHVLLLNNVSVFNDVVYDVVAGYRQGRVKILGFKTGNWQGGFESPGFVYDEAKILDWQPNTDYGIGEVVKYKEYYYTAGSRIAAKSDFSYEDWIKLSKQPKPGLIPNFDYKAEQFRDFYNLDASIYDANQQAVARHLIGYQPREYLDNVIIDDVSQYKFYQGFIKEKGTYNSISKLFDALRSSGFSSVDIKEEWAIKVGDYGANEAYTEIEFPLDETKYRYNPQNVVLTQTSSYLDDTSIYNIPANMLSIKPSSYDSKPFKMVDLDFEQNDYGIFKYPVAGYVRNKDVDHILFNEAALMNYDITLFKENDKIWLGYTSTNDWMVYDFINLQTIITDWSIQGNIVTLDCNKVPDVAKDDIITIRNLDNLNGTYKVQRVYNHYIDIFTFNTTLYHLAQDSTHGLIYKMSRARYASVYDVSAQQYNRPNIRGEKIWIDKDDNNRWLVLENKDVFTESEVPAPIAFIEQRYGSVVKVSGDKQWMFVGTPGAEGGKVVVYNRPNNLSDWTFVQTLSMPSGYLLDGSSSEQFGSSIDVSFDGTLVVIGAPYASNLKGRFKGNFSSSTAYNTGDIVKYNNNLWRNIDPVSGNNNAFPSASTSWERTIHEAVNTGSVYVPISKQGAVAVFRYDSSNNRFEKETIIASYDPVANENFGHRVKLAYTGKEYWLYVSSKQYNNAQGRVQVFRNNLTSELAYQSDKVNYVISISSTAGLAVDLPVVFDVPYGSTQFGSIIPGKKYYIHTIWNSTDISIKESPYSGVFPVETGVGLMTVAIGGWMYSDTSILSVGTLSSNSQFGYDIDVISDASKLVISAPFTTSGSVYIYNKVNNGYALSQTIDASTILNGSTENLVGVGANLYDNDHFGYAVSMIGTELFVSCPDDDNNGKNLGSVYHFDTNNNQYRLRQLLLPPVTFDNERFGLKLSINPSSNVLAVSSGGSNIVLTTFDIHVDRLSFTDDSTRNYILDPASKLSTNSTTYDADSTHFYDRTPATGSVYVYNRFDNDFVYADKLTPSGTLKSDDNFGESISVSDNSIVVGTPNSYINNIRYGTVYTFDYSELSWSTLASQSSVVDVNKFKKAYIYNNVHNTLSTDLDFYDPAKGMIPKIAEQEITYQTFYDPAIYEYAINSDLRVDQSNPWTDEHVGEVWWDLSRVKYTWYEQGDSTFRNNNWGSLFLGSTINVYEWVESIYLPSRYAMLADTPQGLALGISGIPREIDDFTYSSKFKYDPISGAKITTYYFWVKNKTVVPNKPFRNLSVQAVSRLILDPKSQGLRYIAVTGENSLSLVNTNRYLKHSDVSLNVQFYNIDDTDLAIHRQYALIANEDAMAEIPSVIEHKWFDSLVGYDSLGNRVPDIKLSKKQRYGTSNSPRQSWFINRFEALKQTFEYVNSVLSKVQVTDSIDFTNLTKSDPIPTTNSGEVDRIIDIVDELRFVSVINLKTAKLSARVVDGKITNVYVDDPGYGYGTNHVYSQDTLGNPTGWYGPTVNISGTGFGAQLQTVVNSSGSVTKVEIIRGGLDYDIETLLLVVRDYTVLVKTDSEARNGWSLQRYDFNKSTWFRYETQSYDVTRYWSYVDWYEEGFSVNSDINYQITNSSELGDIDVAIGEVVKISNAGYGKWLILQRVDEINGPDFTSDYKVVGKEAATIKFSDSLYNLNQDLGFDTNYGYGINLYDQNPTTELRIILESLRDNILINELRIEYIHTFFNNIYYILSEQPSVDWIFKTSFLKINHNIGQLKQRKTFQSDVLDSYQRFIEEAKPYKTKIREWVSSYQYIEDNSNVITDFDLPSYYDPVLGHVQTVSISTSSITSYPWKNWLDNHTYQLVDIVIDDPGKNYILPPKVIISGGFADNKVTAPITQSSTDLDSIANYVNLGRTDNLSTIWPMTNKNPGIFAKWIISDGVLTIKASGLPYHSYGVLDAINQPKIQDYNIEIPLRAGTNDPTADDYVVDLGVCGFWLNGVAVFNPSAGDGYPKNFVPPPYRFNYNAAYMNDNLDGYSFQEDLASGHADETGKYHYHSFGFADAWTFGKGHADGAPDSRGIPEVSVIPYLGGSLTHQDGHSKILGISLDGYPIYGPYGYSDSTKPSTIKRMVSGYTLKSYVTRQGTEASNIQQFPMGIFIQDYEFTNAGDLDVHNGRFCVTPDYPNGTYAYFVTIDEDLNPVYPYVLGTTYYGIPAQEDINVVPGNGIAPFSVPIKNLSDITATSVERIATATAHIANGKLYSIVVDDPGYGYVSAPNIYLSGGTNNVSDIATAYAVIGNTKARTNKIGIKFDRNTMGYTVDSFRQLDSYTGDGIITEYPLTFAPELEKSKFRILVDGIEIYGVQYDVEIRKVVHSTYTASEGYVIFKEAPLGTITIAYDKNISLYSAADRINYAYNPGLGQYGKELGQLMTGIDYGGVSITSIDFDVSGGWEVIPWDVSSWDNVLDTNNDVVFISDSSTRSFTLPYIPDDQEIINVYLDNTRIDDPEYDGSTVLENKNAIMGSFIGDGSTRIVILPSNAPIVDGTLVTFRKSTSDGSILPTDRSLLDSFLLGGDLAYVTAKGIKAEEIIVDGDGFVTTDTSHGPEELIQGQVVDTLDITVYHAPTDGGPNIGIQNFTGDGITNTYPLENIPGTNDGLMVLHNGLMIPNTVDYFNKTVTLSETPALDDKVVIISFDTAGYELLDNVTFIGDGSTNEFLTSAQFNKGLITVFATVNGVATSTTVVESDHTYLTQGNVIVVFDQAPAEHALIQIMVVRGTTRKYSQVTTETIDIVSGQTEYVLTNPPAASSPQSASAFVIIDGEFLRAPDYQNFTYDGTSMSVSEIKYGLNTLKKTEVNVYRNGVEMVSGREYLFDSTTNYVTVIAGYASIGDDIKVEIVKDNDFFIKGNTLTLTTNYTIADHKQIKVTTFTNHDIYKIKRSEVTFRFDNGYDILTYDSLLFDTLNNAVNANGIINLPRAVSNTSGVFVAIRRKLLSPNVDYRVLENKKQIKILLPEILTPQDYVEVITTNEQTNKPSFAYKIFKDMINRTHYKVIDRKRNTVLAKDLRYFDTKIEVEDGSLLEGAGIGSNIPGIIEINGERIEYMVKEGNILRQLRRATLGTGFNNIIPAGTEVIGLGLKNTIPYADKEIKNNFYGDGSTDTFEIDIVPQKTNITDWYRDTIPAAYGQCDSIEVFVAGRRLRKSPVQVYDQSIAQDSYNGAGDKWLEAEFSVDGINRSVRLTTAPKNGELVTIMRKEGKIWTKYNENVPLRYSDTDVARFVTARTVDLPK